MTNSTQNNRGGQEVNICQFLQWRPSSCVFGQKANKSHLQSLALWHIQLHADWMWGERWGGGGRGERWGGGRGEEEEEEKRRVRRSIIQNKKNVQTKRWRMKKKTNTKTNRKWKEGERRNQGECGNGGAWGDKERNVIWYREMVMGGGRLVEEGRNATTTFSFR